MHDLKEGGRIRDERLLADLLFEWNEYGCAFCGQTGDPEAEHRFRVELHHLDQRRDDLRDRILGACGELVSGCHQAVTEGRIRLFERADGRLIFTRTEAGRAFWQDVRDEPRRRESAVTVEVVSQRTIGQRRAPSGDAEAVARTRYDQLRAVIAETENTRLAIAVMLGVAFDGREHEQLGMSWPDYYKGVGLDRGTAAKMIAVWQAFRGDWNDIPDQDKRELNLERLYYARRLVTAGEMGPREAIHEAVANPTHHLIAKTQGREPVERCSHHECPDCGAEIWHNRKQAE